MISLKIHIVNEHGRGVSVTTDIFPELIPLINSGKVLAIMNQVPATQGRMAFEILYHFLMQKVQPQPLYKLPPQIVLRSNLGCFPDHLPFKFETRPTPTESAAHLGQSLPPAD